MEEEKKTRKTIDWEAVEREYRAGVRSVRDIGKEFGVSHTAIQKRADNEGWIRDLSAKIKAAADAKVAKAEVAKVVSVETKAAERQIIEVNATLLAEKALNQREDICRARAIAQRLWVLVETELDNPEPLANLGTMMRTPDEFGNDKLNDLYFAVIGLPQQVKNVKLLADALKVLIELERKVLKLDTLADDDGAAKKAGEDAGRAVSAGVDAAMTALNDKLASFRNASTQ